MPRRSARALSSIRAAMTNSPSVSRGLCGGVFLKSRASCFSLSVFIGLPFLSLRCLLRQRAFEPILIMRWAETGILSRAGDETLIVQLCAEILGVNVRANLPPISGCAQKTLHKLIHSDRFGTGNRDRGIDWLGERHLGQSSGNVIRGNRLHHTRRQPDRLPFSG